MPLLEKICTTYCEMASQLKSLRSLLEAADTEALRTQYNLAFNTLLPFQFYYNYANQNQNYLLDFKTVHGTCLFSILVASLEDNMVQVKKELQVYDDSIRYQALSKALESSFIIAKKMNEDTLLNNVVQLFGTKDLSFFFYEPPNQKTDNNLLFTIKKSMHDLLSNFSCDYLDALEPFLRYIYSLTETQYMNLHHNPFITSKSLLKKSLQHFLPLFSANTFEIWYEDILKRIENDKNTITHPLTYYYLLKYTSSDVIPLIYSFLNGKTDHTLTICHLKSITPIITSARNKTLFRDVPSQ